MPTTNDWCRDTWSTPQWLFNWLNSIYNFEIDLCASEENTKCGSKFYSVEDDSLKKKWFFNEFGFCNPPYSNIKPWIDKAISEAELGFTTVMLVPTPNGESHYRKVFEKASSITFINGRVAFYNPFLQRNIIGNPRGSCVIEFSRKKIMSSPHIYSVDRKELIKEFS